MSIGDDKAGRIAFELFADKVPKTAGAFCIVASDLGGGAGAVGVSGTTYRLNI